MRKKILTLLALSLSFYLNAESLFYDNIEISQAAVQELFDQAELEKDALFSANFFDEKVIYMYDFDNSTNVASYRFDNSGEWKSKGLYEYYDEKPNLGSGLKKLSRLVYYRYKSRKDRWLESNGFAPFEDESSELAMREKRFYFFRFTAKTIMPSLDNSMLCVDTYTKFCWFYSEPGNFGSVFGNKIPKAWQDYADPKQSRNHTFRELPFYLYDPIGYVQKDGTVVLYDWIKNNIANDTYAPSIKYSSPAKRVQTEPGYSPYLPQGL